MNPSDPDGEIAKSSLGYACEYLHVGGCISAIATAARKCQGKIGENITTVYLRVLLKELEEKHSTTGDSCCAGKGLPPDICWHFTQEYLRFPYFFPEVLTAAIATGHSFIHSKQDKTKNLKGKLISLPSIHTTTVLPSGGPR